MTTFQIIALAVAALLVITSFVDIRSLLGRLMSKRVKLKNPKDLVDTVEGPKQSPKPTISQVVEQWDKLRDMCIAFGSKASAKEMDNVFLFLLDKDAKNEKN